MKSKNQLVSVDRTDLTIRDNKNSIKNIDEKGLHRRANI